MTFTPAELDYLAQQPLGRFATVAPDGVVQNSPVGFFVNDELGTIDIGGHKLSKTRKFANVGSHPQVALVVDDLVSTDPWIARGVEIRGTAEALSDVDPPQPFFSREVIRIRPRRIISWGIEPGRDGRYSRNS